VLFWPSSAGPVISKSYDLKIITSGLLVLRGKEGVDDHLHLIPPSAYSHVAVSVWDEDAWMAYCSSVKAKEQVMTLRVTRRASIVAK